jgi:hypothetical protein
MDCQSKSHMPVYPSIRQGLRRLADSPTLSTGISVAAIYDKQQNNTL